MDGLCDAMYYKTQFNIARTSLEEIHCTEVGLIDAYNHWHNRLHEADRGLMKLEYGPPQPACLHGTLAYAEKVLQYRAEMDLAMRCMTEAEEQLKMTIKIRKRTEKERTYFLHNVFAKLESINGV